MNENDPDIYTEAAAHLYTHPEELEDSARHPGDFKGGPLFYNAGRNPHSFLKIGEGWLSHPVNIRENPLYVAELQWVTDAIRKDDNLPKSVKECTLQHLPALIEWQRKIDRYFNRKVKPKVVEPADEPTIDDDFSDGEEAGGTLPDEEPGEQSGHEETDTPPPEATGGEANEPVD